MYAVKKAGGKQYRLPPAKDQDRTDCCGRWPKDRDRPGSFAVGNGAELQIGTPLVAGASVKDHRGGWGRHDKVRIFKMRRRKHYQKRRGHRQNFTGSRSARSRLVHRRSPGQRVKQPWHRKGAVPPATKPRLFATKISASRCTAARSSDRIDHRPPARHQVPSGQNVASGRRDHSPVRARRQHSQLCGQSGPLNRQTVSVTAQWVASPGQNQRNPGLPGTSSLFCAAGLTYHFPARAGADPRLFVDRSHHRRSCRALAAAVA